MIDSVALVWGRQLGTAERRARGAVEPVADPLDLNVIELHDRLRPHAVDGGQLTSKKYDDGKPYVAGNWPIGVADVMYADGRLELRASLPRVITGELNDIVLDERGCHDALVELTSRTAELIDHRLDLREAVPTRLDPVIQWEVPSVSFICEHLRAAFKPARKLRTENVSPRGGRSVVWGYRTSYALRFYDKGAEVAEKRAKEIGHGIPFDELDKFDELGRKRAMRYALEKARDEVWHNAQMDTTLRFEIQDRRRSHLRLIHENGYRASDIRHELERAVATLGAISNRDLAGLIESYGDWTHRVAYAAASLYFVEHNDALTVVRTLVSSNTYYAWRRRAREAALAVGTWTPEIPANAFESGSTLWAIERPRRAA